MKFEDLNLPDSVYVYFQAITTNLSREYAINSLKGDTSVDAYRAACKSTGRMASKTPRGSACQLSNLPDVSRFLVAARLALSESMINHGCMTFADRIAALEQIVKIKLLKAASTTESVSCVDAVYAIREINRMYRIDKLTGNYKEESEKRSLSLIENDDKTDANKPD